MSTVTTNELAATSAAEPAELEFNYVGSWRLVARRFTQRRAAVFFAAVLLLFVIVAITAPWINRFLLHEDPDAQDLFARYGGPSWDHPLGTDGFGRDVLARLMLGTRVSLLASATALGVALALGVPPGLIAGYQGRWLESALSWVSGALMSVPGLVMALTIVAVLGNNLTNAMIAIGVVTSPRFYRITRASTEAVRKELFIEASRAIGCRPRSVVTRHVVPNIMSPIIVQATLTLGMVVIAEASLSYIGVGVKPPEPSWGSMLAVAANGINQQPWAILPPGLVIVLAVLAFSICGDALSDAFGAQRRSES